jgi:hypothetical protein
MAAVSASSSGKPPSTRTFEMATERFEAFAGGVRPAGLVMLIAPGGPLGGASVLGVTREGATTCPLARLGAIASAQARNKSASPLAASVCSGKPRAIGVLLASKSPPQMAGPNEKIRASPFRREIARGERRRQRFYGEMRRLSGGSAPRRKMCGGSDTVIGKISTFSTEWALFPAAPYLPKSASACVNPFMLTVNFTPAPSTE